jgi:hypothetical protein
LQRRLAKGDREFADPPLEQAGFELMVPPRRERKWEGAGTGGLRAELRTPPRARCWRTCQARSIGGLYDFRAC